MSLPARNLLRARKHAGVRSTILILPLCSGAGLLRDRSAPGRSHRDRLSWRDGAGWRPRPEVPASSDGAWPWGWCPRREQCLPNAARLALLPSNRSQRPPRMINRLRWPWLKTKKSRERCPRDGPCFTTNRVREGRCHTSLNVPMRLIYMRASVRPESHSCIGALRLRVGKSDRAVSDSALIRTVSASAYLYNHTPSSERERSERERSGRERPLHIS